MLVHRRDILPWGFPIYLIVFEWSLKQSVGANDISSFIGPSIATAGLSLIIPITGIELHDGNKLVNEKRVRLVFYSWIFILLGILMWYNSCISAFDSETTNTIPIMPQHIFYGCINYLFAASLTIAKRVYEIS